MDVRRTLTEHTTAVNALQIAVDALRRAHDEFGARLTEVETFIAEKSSTTASTTKSRKTASE